MTGKGETSDKLAPVDRAKRAAASEAAGFVEDGMTLGLGSGSTVGFFLDALAETVREKNLSVTCHATSRRTADRARELGLDVHDDIASLDLAVDGADEVEFGSLNLIKGLGGALTREKMVAQSAHRFVVIAEAEKLVRRLGERAPLPVEILRFGATRTLQRLQDLGLRPKLRMDGGKPFETDNGNLLADCPLEDRIDAVALDRALHAIAGVVETGLFTFGVERALLGHEDGSVRTFEGGVASRAGVGPTIAAVTPFVRRLNPKPILLVMGVSGSGKTTIGILLAQLLGVRFRDGDDLHPEANVRKMHAGHPLDDDDRLPWLHRIREQLASWSADGGGGVLVASMLKRHYRDLVLRSPLGFPGEAPRLVHLVGDRDVLARRLEARRGHFMPSGLLDSQFAALEAPGTDENAIPVSVDGTPGETALLALRQLGAA